MRKKWKWYQDSTYNAIHLWLNSRYPRPSKCVKCQVPGVMQGRRWSIEHALKPGHVHERNINNYDALCKKCHRVQDYANSPEMQANFSTGHIKRKERGLEVNRGANGRLIKTPQV